MLCGTVQGGEVLRSLVSVGSRAYDTRRYKVVSSFFAKLSQNQLFAVLIKRKVVFNYVSKITAAGYFPSIWLKLRPTHILPNEVFSTCRSSAISVHETPKNIMENSFPFSILFPCKQIYIYLQFKLIQQTHMNSAVGSNIVFHSNLIRCRHRT